MADQDHGAIRQGSVYGCPDQPGTGWIQVSGGLVQEQQGRVSQERTGQRDPLPLPRGQPQAALAERRIVSSRQFLDEVGGPRQPGGAADSVTARTGLAEGNIVRRGAGEQVGLLWHPGDLRAPLPDIYGRQVTAGSIVP